MENIIAGVQPTTLLDYPGEIASIIFLKGCNMRCGFCHNSEIVSDENFFSGLSVKNVITQLINRKSKIDHVVVSGGEPLIHGSALMALLNTLKENEFKIKLDTNGLYSSYLRKIIECSRIDYVAMDIKAPLNSAKYANVTSLGDSVLNIMHIKESIDFILNSGIPYEFRTTVVKNYHTLEDLKEIAGLNLGKLYLQQFKPQPHMFEPNLSAYTDIELQEMFNILHEEYPYVKIRGI